MSNGKELLNAWEEELRKAQTLDELKQKYAEATKQINDAKALKKLYFWGLMMISRFWVLAF